MGAINIKHTGSGSDIALSSDGTSLLLDGTAIGGGGGADLYAANPVSATDPSATGNNAVAIGTEALSRGNNDIAIGRSANTLGGGQYNQIAIGNAAQTTSSGAVAIGTDGNATSTSAMALGTSRAAGDSSFAAQIASDSTSYGATANNSIAMGYRAKATGPWATVSGGNTNVASGYHATVIGGSTNLADNIASTVLGGRYGTTRGIRGAAVFGGYGNQITSTQGTSQSGLYILAEQTTDATATDLKTDNQSSSSTANQIVLPNGGAYAFHGTIVGREASSSGTECAAWKVEGLIRREGSAGTTVLVNSATTVLNNAPSWDMSLSANTSLGCLKIEVTGAAKTIRWVATIQTTELIHA